MEMMGNRRTIQLREPEEFKKTPPIQLDDDDYVVGEDEDEDEEVSAALDRLSNLEDDDRKWRSRLLQREEKDEEEIENERRIAEAIKPLVEEYKRLLLGVNTHVNLSIPVEVRLAVNYWTGDDEDVELEATEEWPDSLEEEVRKVEAVQALRQNLAKDWKKFKKRANKIAEKLGIEEDEVITALEQME